MANKLNGKKVNKKRKFTGYFIMDWGSYPDTTLVAIGLPFELLEKTFRKIAGENEKDIVKNYEKELRYLINDNKGFFWLKDGDSKQKKVSILWLKDWRNNWEHYDTLLHEIFHAVLINLGQIRNLISEELFEDEAMSYQFEYLFKQCRRKLYNL